jgi:sugar O-acyltransferase (sialic acid O-acetyltransferase NeuD family)
MITPLLIVGCGGQGRECHEIALAMEAARPGTWHFLGFADDDPDPTQLAAVRARACQVLGTTSQALAMMPSGARVALGIGSGPARQRVAETVQTAGLSLATLVHPDATLGRDVVVGQGCIVAAGVRASTTITLGRGVLLNQNATVGHDTVIHDWATVNPNAAVSGGCVIGARALVGAGAVVLQECKVAADAVVGAAACVTRDVTKPIVVRGVPAR